MAQQDFGLLGFIISSYIYLNKGAFCKDYLIQNQFLIFFVLHLYQFSESFFISYHFLSWVVSECEGLIFDILKLAHFTDDNIFALFK